MDTNYFMFETIDSFLSSLNSLPAAEVEFQEAAQTRQAQLTKPNGSLGRLEDIAIWLAGWQGRECPKLDQISAFVFAGNHGVVEEGISPFPATVTEQMVQNFNNGGAAINALTTVFGHELSVIPLHLDQPTKNITLAAAMTEEETLEALNIGASCVKNCDADLVYFGEMGIGNTTIASTLAAATCGGCGADWAGPGTGLTSEGVDLKSDVIDRALEFHKLKRDKKTKAGSSSPIDIIRLVGGREQAALLGAVVATRLKRIPVLLDGFVVTAAVAPLSLLEVNALDHCWAAHCSAEPAHQRLLDCLWLEPLLNLNMRLGEGTGAALAVELVKGAVATHARMATFEEAAISNRD